MSAEGRLVVRQQRSVAGRPWTQRLVLKGLGLRGPGSEVVVANERAIRGMIRKVLHLVSVDEVSVDQVSGGAPVPTEQKAARGASAKVAKPVKATGAAKAKPAAAKKVKS